MFKTLHSGRIYRRNINTLTTFSEGYHLTVTRPHSDVWYDVWPYSLTLWPHGCTESCRHGEWWIQRSHDASITLELTLEGEIVFESEGRQTVVRAGELYATWPGDNVLMRSSDQQSARQLQLVISGGAIRLLSESLGLITTNHFCFADTKDAEVMRRKMIRIGNMLRRKQFESAAKLSALAYDLLLFLTERQLGGRDYELPGKLTNAVMNMSSDRYCCTPIEEHARALGISRATLSRLFRRHLDSTPRDYRRQMRMESARQLLANSELSVKEIALRLGFGTPFSFSAAFRKYTEMSPTEFRVQNKKNKK